MRHWPSPAPCQRTATFRAPTYLHAAEDAFQFLDTHNRELLNDGVENILDDYCALMAATELYRATHKAGVSAAADRRAQPDGAAHRPRESIATTGVPMMDSRPSSTLRTPGCRSSVCSSTHRSPLRPRRNRYARPLSAPCASSLRVTAEVNNPFGYARQLVRMGDGQMRTAFFFPHDTEAAPWWQGENARLASLACCRTTGRATLRRRSRTSRRSSRPMPGTSCTGSSGAIRLTRAC